MNENLKIASDGTLIQRVYDESGEISGFRILSTPAVATEEDWSTGPLPEVVWPIRSDQ